MSIAGCSAFVAGGPVAPAFLTASRELADSDCNSQTSGHCSQITSAHVIGRIFTGRRVMTTALNAQRIVRHLRSPLLANAG
jgi:hypothetical protein